MTLTVRDGLLQPTHSHTACWIRALRLAGDCHSCNVLLHRGQHDSVYLQVIRPIGRGEELQLWFAEATLTALDIPFLTPLNIQGGYLTNAKYLNVNHALIYKSTALKAVLGTSGNTTPWSDGILIIFIKIKCL